MEPVATPSQVCAQYYHDHMFADGLLIMRCSMYAKGKRQRTFGRRSILIRQLPGHRRDKGRQVAMQTVEIESMAAMAKRQQISCVTMCSKRSWSHESRDVDIYLNLAVVTIDGSGTPWNP